MQTEDLTLIKGTNTIPWRLFVPNDASKEFCVLWLQGWSSSMDSHYQAVERMVMQTGLAFASLDYSGHGLHQTSLEDSTKLQQHEDVIAVFDELRARGYQKIIVNGGSFGGYQAALLTAKRPVYAAVLRAPANYPDDEFELPYKETLRYEDPDEYAKLKASKGMPLDTAATRAIQGYEGFVYVMEHELDATVPTQVPKCYFAAAKHGNYLIIPKTEHSPKLMSHPKQHIAYIEYMVVEVVKAIMLQDRL